MPSSRSERSVLHRVSTAAGAAEALALLADGDVLLLTAAASPLAARAHRLGDSLQAAPGRVFVLAADFAAHGYGPGDLRDGVHRIDDERWVELTIECAVSVAWP